MKSPNLKRGRILFLSSIVVGLMLLTYNVISGILAGASISITQIIAYFVYIGVWLLASQYKVFRKIVGFGLGIIAIGQIIFGGLLHGYWSKIDWVGVVVFSYVCFVLAISPDVDAYLKKEPSKSIKFDVPKL